MRLRSWTCRKRHFRESREGQSLDSGLQRISLSGQRARAWEVNVNLSCSSAGEQSGNGLWDWKWRRRKISFEGIHGVSHLVKVRPEDDYVLTFATIDQPWSIHVGVQLTEKQGSVDARCKARSKQETLVTG